MTRTLGVKSAHGAVVACLAGWCSVWATAGGQSRDAGGQADIVVGASVRISQGYPNESHDEVLASADPLDPNHLLACAIVGIDTPSARDIGYVSTDGGRSWTPTIESTHGAGDPACVLGGHGVGLFAALGFQAPSAERRRAVRAFDVFRSMDGGHTWVPAQLPANATVDDSRLHVDRQYLAIDESSRRFAGRVYMNALMYPDTLDGSRLPFGITLWRSVDHGETFDHPVQRIAPLNAPHLWAGNGAVLTDGTYVAIYAHPNGAEIERSGAPPARPNGTIEVVRSSDGGDSLEPAITISDAYLDSRDSVSVMPVLAVDVSSSPFRDRLYAVWTDSRFDRVTQIVCSYSSDMGKTWSPPALVSDLPPSPDSTERNAFLPAAAVNNAGVLGVLWYDRRDRSGTVNYVPRFAVSLDGGQVFRPSVPTSSTGSTFGGTEQWTPYNRSNTRTVASDPNPFRATVVINRQEWLAGGHTSGLTAGADGVFHPVWVDNRTGVHQLWTAPIAVTERAVVNGELGLSRYKDVTSQVRVETEALSFDRTTKILKVTLVVRNVGASAIPAALIRVLSVRSPVGTPMILGSVNGVAGPGAVFRVPLQAERREQQAPAESGSIQILIQFHDIDERAFVHDARFAAEWLRLDTQILSTDDHSGDWMHSHEWQPRKW